MDNKQQQIVNSQFWIIVFQFLRYRDLAICEQVCLQWRNQLNSDAIWNRRMFKICSINDEQSFNWYAKKVGKFEMKELSISQNTDIDFQKKVFEMLINMDLEKIEISIIQQSLYLDLLLQVYYNLRYFKTSENINENQLLQLSTLPNIEKLHLNCNKLDINMSCLCNFKRLKSISLLYRVEIDQLIELLENNYKTLTGLSIEAEHFDKKDMMLLLSKLDEKKIRKLKIHYFEEYSNEHVFKISTFQKLEVLFLRRVEVDKYSMMELAKNKIFKQLSLGQCGYLDDDFLKILDKTQLQNINLEWNGQITDHGVKILLESSPRLQVVNLTGCKQLTMNCVPQSLGSCMKLLNFKQCNTIDDKILYQSKQNHKYIEMINYYGDEIGQPY